MDIHPLSPVRCDDAAELFESSTTTRGCWCMWFLLSTREVQSGWGETNRQLFTGLAAADNPPAGLIAYDEGKPVGWCAMGPRSRYPRVLRSPLMASRDPSEDDTVWFVPCFFVRTAWRRAGVSRQLLTAVLEHGRDHGAKAIEGFPLAGEGPHKSNRYLGTEQLFAACGFAAVARPSPQRVVMRHDL